jgi:hypothetical protein
MAVLLLAVRPGVATDPVKWGPADHGLRIAVSLGEKSRDIRVTLENVGDKDILIPLGAIVGNPHPILLKVFVKRADTGTSPRVIYTGLGAVGGAVEPLTMGLRARETYTVSTPLDSYYVLDGSEKLSRFIKRRCQLWVELDVRKDQCPNPTTLDSLRRTLPCWYGKVASNVLQITSFLSSSATTRDSRRSG